MKTVELSARDKEIISLVANGLGLNMSPEEMITKEGVVKIIKTLRTKEWSPYDFHDLGVPVDGFRAACAKIGGGFNSFVPQNLCALFLPLSGSSLFVGKKNVDSEGYGSGGYSQFNLSP